MIRRLLLRLAFSAESALAARRHSDLRVALDAAKKTPEFAEFRKHPWRIAGAARKDGSSLVSIDPDYRELVMPPVVAASAESAREVLILRLHSEQVVGEGQDLYVIVDPKGRAVLHASLHAWLSTRIERPRTG